MLLGRIEERRGSGRPLMKYSTNLIEDISRDMRFVDLVELARDRDVWRSMVAHVVDQDMAHRSGLGTDYMQQSELFA